MKGQKEAFLWKTLILTAVFLVMAIIGYGCGGGSNDGWSSTSNDGGSSTPPLASDFVYFSAADAVNGKELWKSDGTAEGTVMVKDINPPNAYYYTSPGNLIVLNGELYFFGNDVNGRELWKSDGTAEGTMMVKDIYPGQGDSYPDNLTALY